MPTMLINIGNLRRLQESHHAATWQNEAPPSQVVEGGAS
jgi:hypothetical protein